MKLTRVVRGWYETTDGRHAILRCEISGRWRVATVDESGDWLSQEFKTRREAARALASREIEERTGA